MFPYKNIFFSCFLQPYPLVIVDPTFNITENVVILISPPWSTWTFLIFYLQSLNRVSPGAFLDQFSDKLVRPYSLYKLLNIDWVLKSQLSLFPPKNVLRCKYLQPQWYETYHFFQLWSQSYTNFKKTMRNNSY